MDVVAGLVLWEAGRRRERENVKAGFRVWGLGSGAWGEMHGGFGVLGG